MKQVDWFERKFEFPGKENILPSLMERLEGTPVRLSAKIKRIDPALLTIKPGGKWSIAEHIGHLADLEPLWQGRLEDILNQEEMRPADLLNRKTDEANHNAKPIAELLQTFNTLRQVTLENLLNLREEDVFKSALHPRLKTPMRVIDLFTFVAEHDDHHLAKITEITRA